MHISHSWFKAVSYVAAAALAGVTASACTEAGEDDVSSEQASAAITPGQNEAGKAFMKAFGENDLEAIVAVYTNDAVYHPIDAMELKGTKEIRANTVEFITSRTATCRSPGANIAQRSYRRRAASPSSSKDVSATSRSWSTASGCTSSITLRSPRRTRNSEV